ncbi:MAG: hypothetical protein IT454_11610 [Planctomycetes bacterium]|nr:hypothetical protein [Planctomycetota bacterium]
MSLTFALLAVRRTLARGVWLGAATLAVLVVATQRRGGTLLESALDAEATTRVGAWTAFALSVWPWLAWRAASLIPMWRESELEFVAGVPASRARLVLSSWFGVWLAMCASVLLAAGAAEATAPRSSEVLARVGEIALPHNIVLGGAEPVVWRSELPERAAAERLRLHLEFVPLSNYADVEWSVARAGRTTRALVRVSSHSELELPFPDGSGEAEFRLSRAAGEGLVMCGARPLELLARGKSSRWCSIVLAAHAALAGAVCGALALGLGAWMRASLAFGLAAAAQVALAFAEPEWARQIAPWSALPAAFEACGRGLVPQAPGLAECAASFAWTAAGLALASAGIRRWRRPA